MKWKHLETGFFWLFQPKKYFLIQQVDVAVPFVCHRNIIKTLQDVVVHDTTIWWLLCIKGFISICPYAVPHDFKTMTDVK